MVGGKNVDLGDLNLSIPDRYQISISHAPQMNITHASQEQLCNSPRVQKQFFYVFTNDIHVSQNTALRLQYIKIFDNTAYNFIYSM